VGKRSPILGYNHNVRYRGLVFHVQTEDSGVASPHLFTHLFHHGVIVSTRKLVYDAGSAEDVIKSLMQAQHKAVLKDLRRGHYDDKIDAYLGGTPGLLPRGVEEPAARPSEVELAPSAGAVAEIALGAPTEQVLPVIEEISAPVVILEKTPAASPTAPPPLPELPSVTFRPSRPALPFSQRPAAADTTLKTEAPAFDLDDPDLDLSPEIEIELEVDDDDGAVDGDAVDGDAVDGDAVDGDAVPALRRMARDTEAHVPRMEVTPSHGEPTRPARADEARRSPAVSDEVRRAPPVSDGVPGAIRPSSPSIPPAPDSRRLGDRPSTINAATLPPARPISRPPSRPALSAPQVVSRPVMADDRGRRDSEAVEVYSPALPSAELPAAERPGQYAQHKRTSTRIPIETLKTERSGGVPVPAGLGPPRRAGSSPGARPTQALPASGSAPTSIPRETPRHANVTEPLRSRSPTPQRMQAQAGPGPGRSTHTGGGVVMSRPAVIVGAPAKTTGTIPRIRKAREDEGRGFGQGLISEKSLDEVILAYLSEDADEK
jgi:hypothetical protein